MQKWLKSPAVQMGAGMALLLAVIWIIGWALGFQGQPRSFGS